MIRLLLPGVRQEWSPEDLIGSWTLVGKDWRRVGNKSGATRLGFSLLLKFLSLRAGSLPGAEELRAAVVVYLAEQVKVDPALLQTCRWSGSTIEYHRAQVREAFGFRESTRSDEDKLASWLATEMYPVELRDEQPSEEMAGKPSASAVYSIPGRSVGPSPEPCRHRLESSCPIPLRRYLCASCQAEFHGPSPDRRGFGAGEPLRESLAVLVQIAFRARWFQVLRGAIASARYRSNVVNAGSGGTAVHAR